jgi:hypothetical protein
MARISPGFLIQSARPESNDLSESTLGSQFARGSGNVAGLERLVACSDTLALGSTGRVVELHAGMRLKHRRSQVQSVHTPEEERSTGGRR